MTKKLRWRSQVAVSLVTRSENCRTARALSQSPEAETS